MDGDSTEQIDPSQVTGVEAVPAVDAVAGPVANPRRVRWHPQAAA